MKKEISFGQLVNFFPAPVVLVTAKSAEKENVVTIAWCGIVCSQPPMLSISVRPSRYSSELIKNSGEFVVNIPSEKLLEEVDKAGTVSGRDKDKFELLNLKKEQAKKVSAPIIADCSIALECKLKQTVSLGTHDCFIAEIVCVQADSKIVMENKVDFFKLKPLVLLGPEYWNLGEKLEDYGFSKK
jgi:flavin reductase (DIM6/NTAB) family NADH-FMN oxidoreductase RutF